MTDVLVLGAGVVGMSTAYALARRGHRVTVIDEGASVAAKGASFGNGAQLSYCYTDALASPSLARNLPKFALGLDESFRWKPGPSPAFWSWTAAFLANTRRPAFERNTLDLLTLAFESRDALADLTARHAIDFDHRRTGKLHLLASARGLQDARRMMDLKNARGAGQSLLSVEAAVEREPALAAYGSTFAGALWSPLDELGDPVKFCEGLRRLLEADFGATFLMGMRIDGFRVERGRLAAVRTAGGDVAGRQAVVALGVGSRRIARTVGVSLPIWPLQGYSLTVPATDRAPSASITDTARKLVFCRIGDRLRVAGLADLGAGRTPFRRHRFDVLLRGAKEAFPAAGDYSGAVEAWTGCRPMTPNSQPVVGPTRIVGLNVNCGHGSLGWTLAMGSAERLASRIEPQLR